MKYYNVNETKKLMLQALKEAFPGTRFFVKKDGQSLRVRWVDGPSKAQVNRIAQVFAGETFDGMTDLRESVHRVDRQTGEPISFLTSFIFTDRAFSPAAVEAIRQELSERTGCKDWPFREPYGWPKSAAGAQIPGFPYECRGWKRVLSEVLDSTVFGKVQDSPTATRFTTGA
jgi:hypothetical protein